MRVDDHVIAEWRHDEFWDKDDEQNHARSLLWLVTWPLKEATI